MFKKNVFSPTLQHATLIQPLVWFAGGTGSLLTIALGAGRKLFAFNISTYSKLLNSHMDLKE